MDIYIYYSIIQSTVGLRAYEFVGSGYGYYKPHCWSFVEIAGYTRLPVNL